MSISPTSGATRAGHTGGRGQHFVCGAGAIHDPDTHDASIVTWCDDCNSHSAPRIVAAHGRDLALRIALVKERLSEANAKVTLSKEENSKVEARIRILEREANAEKTSLLQEAGVKEDALRVQLRAVRVIMLLQPLYENPSILSLFSFACNDSHRTGLL